ncbi:MAG: PAS domain-containing sensor histidine kinase [Actinomycetota bacterium]
MTTSEPSEELRRLRDLVNDVDAVVWEADASGRFTFVSDRSAELLGYAPSAFLDEPDLWAERIHPDDRDTMLERLRGRRDASPAHDLEYRFLRRDGEVVWLREVGHTVFDADGTPLLRRGVTVDITTRRIAEAQVREESAELRALDETKNTFLAAVSHDLRTPLAAILGLAVTLERHTLDEADAKDLASRIATNARRLDRMVTDLLDLDRLTRGVVEPSLRETDLGALVARVVGESDVVRHHELTVATETLVAEVDAAKVERIVENLLANAVRHTPPSSRIWVSVRAEGDGVLLLVEDDGPGVPADQRSAVFEPFRQAAGAEHSPGVGIGLTLVERFAELHGGRAWVEARDGGGASFRVWLPAGSPEAGPAAS